VKLLEALAEVSQKDLDEVIAECETIEKRLEQLNEVRKIIELKLGLRRPPGHQLKRGYKRKATEANGSQPVAQSQPEQPSPQNMSITDRYRKDAKEYIMANGATKQAELAKRCDIPAGSIAAVIKHKWFNVGEHGVGLTQFAYA